MVRSQYAAAAGAVQHSGMLLPYLLASYPSSRVSDPGHGTEFCASISTVPSSRRTEPRVSKGGKYTSWYRTLHQAHGGQARGGRLCFPEARQTESVLHKSHFETFQVRCLLCLEYSKVDIERDPG